MSSRRAATISVLVGTVLATSVVAGPAHGAVVADSAADPKGDTHHEEAYESSPRWMRPLSDIRKLTLRRNTDTHRVTAVATMQKMRTKADPGQEGLLFVLEGYDKGYNLVWSSSFSVSNGDIQTKGSDCRYMSPSIRPAVKQAKIVMDAACVTRASTYKVTLDAYSLHDGHGAVTSDYADGRFKIY